MLGYFGELHPRVLEALKADGPLVAFEVILERIPDAKEKPTRAKPMLELSAFQPVSRDFAFIVDRSVKAGEIVRAAQGVDKKLITGVSVFDIYEGKGIDDGQEVRRHRRDLAAARKDPDRSGDRRGGGEDRRRRREENRRRIAGMTGVTATHTSYRTPLSTLPHKGESRPCTCLAISRDLTVVSSSLSFLARDLATAFASGPDAASPASARR